MKKSHVNWKTLSKRSKTSLRSCLDSEGRNNSPSELKEKKRKERKKERKKEDKNELEYM